MRTERATVFKGNNKKFVQHKIGSQMSLNQILAAQADPTA